MAKSLYQQLRDAGATLDHHESDLYVLATPEAREIVQEWRRKEKHAGVAYTTFQSEGKTWLDIPFAYEPFWEKKSRRANNSERKSCGFAVATYDQNMIEDNARERAKEDVRRERVGGKSAGITLDKFITRGGEITKAGWAQLNKDVQRIERNSLAWLRKTFLDARDEGHDGYDDLIGTVWYDPANKRQMELLELACPSPGRGERIDMTDMGFGQFRTAFDGVSSFGQSVLGGAITFFDCDEEFE